MKPTWGFGLNGGVAIRTVSMMRDSGTDRGQVINRASAYAISMLYDELKRDTNQK